MEKSVEYAVQCLLDQSSQYLRRPGDSSWRRLCGYAMQQVDSHEMRKQAVTKLWNDWQYKLEHEFSRDIDQFDDRELMRLIF